MNILKYILSFFGKKSPKVQFLGVLGERNRVNVYEFSEMVAGVASPTFVEKPVSEWRTFLSQYQSTSSACVAFTAAKIAQVLFFLRTGRKIKFSPGWVYRQRNPKGLGMWIDDVMRIASTGMITEELYPSEGIGEVEINSLPDYPYDDGVAKEFAIPPNWVNLPLTFDIVASTLQATKKGIMLWFDFGAGEWFNVDIPKTITNNWPYRHSVTAVDVVKYQGVEYIVIEDSANTAGTFGHRKLISRQFFSRCLLARYPLSFKFDAQTVKPSYNGTTSSLQDCLTFEGVFPSNITQRGYYGKTTTESVQKFQIKYGLEPVGTVGPKTRALLYQKYP